jgi:hypothetical protein
MNKTLLLILLDFLLLHMIHDSPWNKVEKENAHLRGGTDTYAKHAEELQFVRLQMQAKEKETEMLADQLAFSRKSEAEKAKEFARAQAEIKRKEEELKRTGGALSETERQRLIALKDAAERQKKIELKEQDLNTIKDQMAERDKAIITLTNKVERLNTNIDGLKNQIGDLKSDFNTKYTKLVNNNEDLIKKNATLDEKNKNLNSSLTSTKGQLATARGQLTQKDQLITQKDQLITQKNQLIQAREITITGLQKDKGNLTEKIGEEQERTVAAATMARQQQERAVKAEKNVVEATSQAKAVKEERDHVLKQNEKLTNDIKAVAERTDFNTARTLNEVVKAAKAIPQSPNKLFNEFVANRVPLLMQLSRSKAGIMYVNGKPQAAPRQIRKTSQTILVQGEKYLYALLHADQSPFVLGPQGSANWEKANGVFRRNGRNIDVHWLGFLKNDPRIVAVPLHKDSQDKNFLNINKTYPLAKRPQDYPEAVIIHNGEEYGVVKFKVDPNLPNYVLMDKPFLGGIFSKRMNPSKGDIVVSRTGELLGIMVNSKYCLIIREKELDNVSNSFAKHVVLKDKTHINNLNKILQNLRSIIQAKPNALH